MRTHISRIYCESLIICVFTRITISPFSIMLIKRKKKYKSKMTYKNIIFMLGHVSKRMISMSFSALLYIYHMYTLCNATYMDCKIASIYTLIQNR